MQIVVVKVPRTEGHIYNLKFIRFLDVKVETLKSRPGVGQCFRCLRYGHSQSRCTAPCKCVRCGGDHYGSQCERPLDEPATCANCGEAHPANYRGCSRWPKPRQIPPTSNNRTPKSSQVQFGLNYAESVKTPNQRRTAQGSSSTRGTAAAIPQPTIQFPAGTDINVMMIGAVHQMFAQICQAMQQFQVLFPNPSGPFNAVPR